LTKLIISPNRIPLLQTTRVTVSTDDGAKFYAFTMSGAFNYTWQDFNNQRSSISVDVTPGYTGPCAIFVTANGLTFYADGCIEVYGAAPSQCPPSTRPIVVVFGNTNPTYDNFTGYCRVLVCGNKAYTMGSDSDNWVRNNRVPLYGISYPTCESDDWASGCGLTLYRPGDQAWLAIQRGECKVAPTYNDSGVEACDLTTNICTGEQKPKTPGTTLNTKKGNTILWKLWLYNCTGTTTSSCSRAKVANAKVSLYSEFGLISAGYTNSDGYIEFRFTVPNEWEGKNVKTFAYLDDVGNYSPTITLNVQPSVNPQISVSPTTVNQGDYITISGSGFTPNGKIDTCIAGWCMTPNITVGSDGKFTVQMQVGTNIPAGNQPVWAHDQASNKDSNVVYITVQAPTPTLMYESAHFKWYGVRSLINGNIEQFYPYMEDCYNKIVSFLGFEPTGYLKIEIDIDESNKCPASPGTLVVRGGTAGGKLNYCASEWVNHRGIREILPHELVNLFTGYLSAGWPWADGSNLWFGQSPFPYFVALQVMDALGYGSMANELRSSLSSTDRVFMFEEYLKSFGWNAFKKFFALFIQNKDDLTKFSEPDKTHRVFAYMTYAVGKNINPLFVKYGFSIDDNLLKQQYLSITKSFQSAETTTIDFNIDDGKGNVGKDITVVVGQKFWFKGTCNKPAKRIDIWFNEYNPYPPYNYVKSWWLCTLYTNDQGYFDSSPDDLCWIEDTGKKDALGNKIYRLMQSKLGKVWEGVILESLEFDAEADDGTKSNIAVVRLPKPPVRTRMSIEVWDTTSGETTNEISPEVSTIAKLSVKTGDRLMIKGWTWTGEGATLKKTPVQGLRVDCYTDRGYVATAVTNSEGYVEFIQDVPQEWAWQKVKVFFVNTSTVDPSQIEYSPTVELNVELPVPPPSWNAGSIRVCNPRECTEEILSGSGSISAYPNDNMTVEVRLYKDSDRAYVGGVRAELKIADTSISTTYTNKDGFASFKFNVPPEWLNQTFPIKVVLGDLKNVQTSTVNLSVVPVPPPPTPECTEGAVEILEYCPDKTTWKKRRVCKGGVWVYEEQACPSPVPPYLIVTSLIAGGVLVGALGYTLAKKGKKSEVKEGG